MACTMYAHPVNTRNRADTQEYLKLCIKLTAN